MQSAAILIKYYDIAVSSLWQMSIHKQWANAKVGQGRYYIIVYASLHCNSSGKAV